jgi:hypothetical protein
VKECKSCGERKPDESFSKYYNGRNSTRLVCKVCRGRARRHRSRLRRIEAYKIMGERCADCNIKSSSKNYIIFDFHHLDPSKKDFSFGEDRFVSDKKYWAEIKKCVLLCSNCHRLRHWNVSRA